MLAFFNVSESVFELFDPDEGDDGVRAETHEGRHETSEERHRTLAEGEPDHVKCTYVRRNAAAVFSWNT